MFAVRLIEQARQLLQARDVIVVVLDRRERKQRNELRGVDVNAAHLVDRHLPVFERRVIELLLQPAHYQRLVQGFLLGEARRVDRLEAREEISGLRQVSSGWPRGKRR